MTEINWRQELLDSQQFNEKERDLLVNGPKSLSQSWLMGALYTRWKKLKGFREPPPPDLKSSYLDWEKSISNNESA